MKTCARCGRTYPPDQTMCPSCGLRLPGMRGPAQAAPAIGHIEFLLGQLDEWVTQGWVGPDQARRLYDTYQERRSRLLSGPLPAETLSQTPPPPMSRPPVLPPPPFSPCGLP